MGQECDNMGHSSGAHVALLMLVDMIGYAFIDFTGDGFALEIE